MPRFDLATPPLTAELPGTGGRIKVRPEDFEVEEIPAYKPSGEGEHLYLKLEKIGIGAEHLTKSIAQTLGIPAGMIGVAGMKDRQAVTRQWVSVPVSCEAKVGRLDRESVRVLEIARHGNKLKPGHLLGNRFRILIRDADRERADAATAILERIRREGLPNYYGPQRFGRDGETADLGFECLRGRSRNRLRPFLFRLAISAAQSVLFNRVLMRRHADGLLRTVLSGDVMMKWPRGGLFVAEDVDTEQRRLDARETVTGGPMFGHHMFAAKGIAAERERVVLQEAGLSEGSFAKFGPLAGGTRRHNLIYLDDLTHEWEADGLRLAFSLPSGSYATTLLREVMKVDLSDAGREEEAEATQ